MVDLVRRSLFLSPLLGWLKGCFPSPAPLAVPPDVAPLPSPVGFVASTQRIHAFNERTHSLVFKLGKTTIGKTKFGPLVAEDVDVQYEQTILTTRERQVDGTYKEFEHRGRGVWTVYVRKIVDQEENVAAFVAFLTGLQVRLSTCLYGESQQLPLSNVMLIHYETCKRHDATTSYAVMTLKAHDYSA